MPGGQAVEGGGGGSAAGCALIRWVCGNEGGAACNRSLWLLCSSLCSSLWQSWWVVATTLSVVVIHGRGACLLGFELSNCRDMSLIL